MTIFNLVSLTFLIIVVICSPGNALTVIMDQTEHTFCFEVKNNSIENGKGLSPEELPRVTISLEVDYPFDVAEAGQAYIEDLSIGLHNVSYKYRTTNMTHDLLVKFDGSEKTFTKSAVPRWRSVSTFREVIVFLEGSIQLLQCEGQPEPQNVLTALRPMETSSNEPNGNFFIIDSHEDAPSSADETRIEDELFHLNILTNTTNGIPKVTLEKHNPQDPHKDSTYPVLNSTDARIDQNKTNSLNKPITSTRTNKPLIPDTDKQISVTRTNSTLMPDTYKHIAVTKTNTVRTNATRILDTYPEVEEPSPPFSETIAESNFTDAFSLNHSDFETKWSESRSECESQGCISKEFGHDYTLAFILFGILGAIALIAAVISIVFHRKKKKLMVSDRDRPTNRLRQKLQEESMADGECQLMLRDIENTYEEIR